MTPYQINILLWYHTREGDWNDPSVGSFLYKEAMDSFASDNLLCLDLEAPKGQNWFPTPRLHAFCDALCRTPLPVSAWIDPRDASSLTNAKGAQ